MIKELKYSDYTAKVEVRNENEHIQKHWMGGKFYETQRNGLLNYIHQKESKGGLYIDIGASIGNHSVFFGVVMEATKLVAVEPNPNSFNHLSENINLVIKASHQTLEEVLKAPFALGEKNGTCSMKYISDSNVGMSEVVKGNDVIIKPIDSMDYFDGYNVIKIDVEHYNRQLILGAMETFKRGTGSIYIEAESEAERDETDELMALCDYKRVPNLVLNHTPTYLYKKI